MTGKRGMAKIKVVDSVSALVARALRRIGAGVRRRVFNMESFLYRVYIDLRYRWIRLRKGAQHLWQEIWR
jgi:hypothetical protein